MTAGQAILGVSWASVTIGTVLVSVRLYSRGSRKILSADDYTIAVALVRGFASIIPEKLKYILCFSLSTANADYETC